jgi:hypothetical protein
MAHARIVLAAVLIVSGASSVARADDAPAAGAEPAVAPATPSTVGESPGVVPALPAKVEDQSAKSYPAIGGHIGTLLPIVTFGSKTTTIGADFATIGMTPGVTIHLDDKWAIDLEMVVLNELKNTPAATTVVIDPGVIRKFDGFVTGLRVASQVGAPTNVGLIPIFVLPFKISNRLAWFAEIDVPIFLRDSGTKAQLSATGIIHTGFGF